MPDWVYSVYKPKRSNVVRVAAEYKRKGKPGLRRGSLAEKTKTPEQERTGDALAIKLWR